MRSLWRSHLNLTSKIQTIWPRPNSTHKKVDVKTEAVDSFPWQFSMLKLSCSIFNFIQYCISFQKCQNWLIAKAYLELQVPSGGFSSPIHTTFSVSCICKMFQCPFVEIRKGPLLTSDFQAIVCPGVMGTLRSFSYRNLHQPGTSGTRGVVRKLPDEVSKLTGP